MVLAASAGGKISPVGRAFVMRRKVASAARTKPRMPASGFCHGSTSAGAKLSAPSNIITNRNKTMIAPAYTVICAMAMNGAPSNR